MGNLIFATLALLPMTSKLLLLAAVGGARAFSSVPKDAEVPTRMTYSSSIPGCTDTPGWDNGYAARRHRPCPAPRTPVTD